MTTLRAELIQFTVGFPGPNPGTRNGQGRTRNRSRCPKSAACGAPTTEAGALRGWKMWHLLHIDAGWSKDICVTLLPSLKPENGTWKWMVGILVSFWDGLFSGAMLVSGSVYSDDLFIPGSKLFFPNLLLVTRWIIGIAGIFKGVLKIADIKPWLVKPTIEITGGLISMKNTDAQLPSDFGDL